MKKLLLSLLKLYCAGAGLVVAFAILVLATLFFPYHKIPFGSPFADPAEPRQILNKAGLGKSEIVEITHGIHTPKNLFGEHLTAYAIKVDDLNSASLTSGSLPSHQWYRGDKLSPTIQATLPYFNTLKRRIHWLPSDEELKNSDCYFTLENLYAEGSGDIVTGAKLTIVRFSNKTIYHVDSRGK